MNYYAFTDDETIELIGNFPDISATMDHEPFGTIWVLSEHTLCDLRLQIDRLVPRGTSASTSDALLRDLVQALDNAFISSWQSTARWQDQLDSAREHIDNFSREKGTA